MNNHQGIKAEIDARNDSFTACIELGKTLLARKHYASEEVECSLKETVPSENPQKTPRKPPENPVYKDGFIRFELKTYSI